MASEAEAREFAKLRTLHGWAVVALHSIASGRRKTREQQEASRALAFLRSCDKVFDRIADVVLAYRPKPKSEPARKRQRRRKRLAQKERPK